MIISSNHRSDCAYILYTQSDVSELYENNEGYPLLVSMTVFYGLLIDEFYSNTV